MYSVSPELGNKEVFKWQLVLFLFCIHVSVYTNQCPHGRNHERSMTAISILIRIE